jgi:hypothetical protein
MNNRQKFTEVKTNDRLGVDQDNYKTWLLPIIANCGLRDLWRSQLILGTKIYKKVLLGKFN